MWLQTREHKFYQWDTVIFTIHRSGYYLGTFLHARYMGIYIKWGQRCPREDSLRQRLRSASTWSILNNGEFPFSLFQSTPRIKAGWFKLNLQRSKALSSTLVALYKYLLPCLLLVWNFPNDILLGKRIFNSHAYRSIWNTSMKVEKKSKY